MQRQTYQKIVDIVEGDSQSVAQLVEKYGFGSAKEWLGRWKSVWENNLENNCDERDNCMIQLS
jgi:hypothetical protein